MKIIYLGYPVQKKNEKQHIWSIADNNMEIGFINELAEKFGKDKLTVYSLSDNPDQTKKFIVNSQLKLIDGGISVKYLSYINISKIRGISRFFNIFLDIVKNTAQSNEKTIIITYNINLFNLLTNFSKRIFKYKTVCFLAGIVEIKEESKNKNNLRKKTYNTILNLIRRFIFATNDGIISFNIHSVEDYFPKRKYLILMPGHDNNLNTELIQKTNSEVINILFTGEISDHNGIYNLLESMKFLPSCYRLNICGRGELKEVVESYASIDSRIKYLGFVSHSEALELQKKADILVLIRTGNNNLSRYGISSKIIEYFISGTPIIANKVESLPEELHKFINLVGVSPHDIAEGIKKITEKRSDYIEAVVKAQNGLLFVHENANWSSQGSKINSFLRDL